MNESSKKSRKNASRKIMILTTIRNPIWPPGKPVSKCSTHFWPSTPWNTRLKIVEPIRMKTTKHESFVVVLRACFSSEKLSRPRTSAMMIAPIAPMAPPSVGVAIPRKIVPNTRKISNSGGISTKVTRSAMRDSRPIRVTLLISAITKANSTPAHIEITMVSSVAAVVTSVPVHQLTTRG
jgi:hypothetical protein